MFDWNFYKFVLELIKSFLQEHHEISYIKKGLKLAPLYNPDLALYLKSWFKYFEVKMI